MPANRGKRRFTSAIVPFFLMIPCALLPAVMEAESQTDPIQDPSAEPPLDVATRKPLDASKRSAVAAARRELEFALEDNDGNIRWAALRAARNLREPWIAEFVLPVCSSPNMIERVLALEVVANTNPKLGKTAFLEALISGERSIRLRGLLGLSALGDEDTVPNLVEILKDDPDPDLRAAAARALGKIGDIKASFSLYEAIESRFPPVREQAVMALVAIGDEGVGEFLIERLREDRDPGEQETLRLLALVPDSALISLIEPYLKHDDDTVRSLAAAAIFSILDRVRSAQP